MKNKKGAKYYSKKVIVDGITFDSKKEANRYKELLLLQQAGKISDLRLQAPYELIPNQYEEETILTPKRGKGKTLHKLVERKVEYVADFEYTDMESGETVVEDVKGYRNSTAYAVFVIKRKLMYRVYRIKVKEI